MIAPEELRLGNYFQVPTMPYLGLQKVQAITGKYISGIDFNLVEPIELTEDWLEKFGLKDSETGYEVIVKQTKFSAIKAKGFFSVGLAGPFGLYMVKIKYVHQFQNLYQSVFLEELKIKEQK